MTRTDASDVRPSVAVQCVAWTAQGQGFMVYGFGFEVQGLGFRG